MSISFMYFFSGIKESSAIHITSTFSIHTDNISCIPNNNSNFKFLWRFWYNIENWNLVRRNWSWMNFYPTFNNTLWNRWWWMIKLSIFYRLKFIALPFRREKPIFQIHGCFSNRVITKNIVIIHYIYNYGRTSRKYSFKIIVFIKSRIWVI